MPKKIYASDVRKITSKEFDREVGEINITGKDGEKEELARTDLKKHILRVVQGGKTGLTVEKYLKKSGVTGYQEEKRKNLLTLIKGGKTGSDRPTAAMIREEKMRKRANVIGGRQSFGMGNNMAVNLEEKRSGVSDKNLRKERRLESALVTAGFKTGSRELGLEGQKYAVTGRELNVAKKSLTSSLERKSHLTFAGQKNDGGITSIDDRSKSATSITGGIGVIKKMNTPGGGLGGSRGGHIPLSKAA
jgi:hypothetical protein